MDKIYAIDSEDRIVRCLQEGTDAEWILGWRDLTNIPVNNPVIFRSMTQRKTVSMCEKQNRNYYYIDTGYIGNLEKRKDWHRVVKNGMQHSKPRYDLPADRYQNIIGNRSHLRFAKWRRNGGPILLVTPSDKPCLFYGIDREKWVNETIEEIKKHTDRPIVIRDKGLRRERIGRNSIYNQLKDDKIFAVVTYNSIAATEAIGFGVPAFTLAPNAADEFCLKDLSKIETPLYEDPQKVIAWQNWLGYCQYHPEEMKTGLPLKIIEEYNLS
jgi:hypothetical protein